MILGGGPGLRLIRFRGVDVYLDFSVLIIMGLIIYSQIRSLPYYWSSSEIGIAAVMMAVLFIGSILVHEVSHASMGMWLGAKVSTIRLYIFGGATFFTYKPTSEGRNFWISIIGPISNLALWGIFLLARNLLQENEVAYVVCDYLQFINLILAGFNALPGYPMDGGQALRSALIWLTKREVLSAQIVMVVGCLTGGLIGLWAVQSVIGHDNTGFFFRALIAFWVISGSINQYRQLQEVQPVNRPAKKVAKVAPLQTGVPVGQIMSTPLQAFSGETKVADFMQQTEHLGLLEKNWLPVLREGYLLGVINRGMARRVPLAEQMNLNLERAMVTRRDLFALDINQDSSAAREMVKANQELPVIVLGASGVFAGFIGRENLKD